MYTQKLRFAHYKKYVNSPVILSNRDISMGALVLRIKKKYAYIVLLKQVLSRQVKLPQKKAILKTIKQMLKMNQEIRQVMHAQELTDFHLNYTEISI